MNNEIDVPAYWRELAEKIYNDRGVVIVLGSPDTGKTTLINYLFTELNSRGCLTSIIDADIGQSFYGVPTTINLVKVSTESNGVAIGPSYFVGSTSPLGHLLQMVVGLRKLLDISQGSDVTLIDTTGFVMGGAAWELKYQKIDTVSPRHIVAIQRDNEIENILHPQDLRKLAAIHRFPVHDKVKPKSQDQRRAYRKARYKAYFQNARRSVFSLTNVSIMNPYKATIEDLSISDKFKGMLIGLNNNENFVVCLGILDGVNIKRKGISFITPIFGTSPLVEDVKTIRLGSVRLDSTYADYKVNL
ncbi:MAG: Clp1/GlmU family protein [Candidatus Brocadiales bacterium]